ncbi:ABC transporter permease [Methanolobus sp. ZRKC2]|uniref:ABC transporter permease n=1 Tax=Methanolobus sp. ZRKC2 TaxID=3125783 RepID=UPI003247C52F
MKPVKIFRISLNMVKHNRLRSWLTIIGVVIGIASVMTVVTMGDYFHNQVTKTLEMESDTIEISGMENGHFSNDEFVGFQESDLAVQNEYIEDPDADMSGKLTKKDVYTLKKIPEIQYINVIVKNYAIINLGSETGAANIKGVDPDVWGKLNSEKIEQGRTLRSGDRNVIVITNSLANEEFPDRKIRLNQMILLSNNSYRVVGILAKEEGELFDFRWDGTNIYMPYEEAYKISSEYSYNKEEGIYDSIDVMLYKGSDADTVVKKIDEKLQLARRVDEESRDFYIHYDLSGIEGANKVIAGLTAFLAFIAGISLLVGSVGIANSMFTSVLEKTKEIGIMKAIGARNRDILLLFLCNAALIGLVGGIIGIILGTATVQLIIFALSMYLEAPFEFTLSLKATILASFVSIIVGLIAGYMPAKSASKLNPVDALKYE